MMNICSIGSIRKFVGAAMVSIAVMGGWTLAGAGVTYSQIDYQTVTAVPTTQPIIGTLSEMLDGVIYGKECPAAGYKFNSVRDQGYKITATFTSANSIDDYVGVSSMVLGSLIGDGAMFGGDLLAGDAYFVASGDDGKQWTLTTYVIGTGAELYLLMYETWMNELEYSLIIEETKLTPYDKFNYTHVDFDDKISGVLSDTLYEKGRIDPAAAFRFGTSSDKTYKITAKFTSNKIVGLAHIPLYILGALTGGDINDDIIKLETAHGSGNQLTAAAIVQGTGDSLRVLIRDREEFNYAYSLLVEEIEPPVTLQHLLNNTSRVITYSNNLEFTTGGHTDDLVMDDYENLNFGWYGRFYYCAAYKTALTENNQIKIFSSVKGTVPKLYIYKSVGAGAYEYVTDYIGYYDGNNHTMDTVYYEFTASSGGDYYIVIAGEQPHSVAGEYYLTVWNTAVQPDNGFGNTSISTSDRKIQTPAFDNNAAVVAPTGGVSFEVVAGPNPAKRGAGVVRFFAGAGSAATARTQKTATGALTVYDATGNVVRRLAVSGDIRDSRDNVICEWNLRDARGRLVPAGTYLVRGTLTVNGKREKVSVMVGVR